jgi:hypothetical protein
MAYVDPDIVSDETTAAIAVLDGLADRIDDWEAADGHPEADLAESVGVVAATVATLVKDEERKDYAGFGQRVLGILRGSAEPASALTRWTFNDAVARTIPDGTELVMYAADGTAYGFATVGDWAMDGTAAVADGVPVTALEVGPEPNGVVGEAPEHDDLPGLLTVELTAPAANGTDEEDLDAYVDKIARKVQRRRVVPIVTDDYADTALDHPSVARAVAVRLLDLDNPPAPGDDPSSGGHVTVFTADAAGNPNTAGVKLEVIALMYGEDRPLAVTVHAGDPEYTDVQPAVTIRLEPGADAALTQAAVGAALLAAFDKSAYGLDEDAPGRWRPPSTDDERRITHYDVAAVALATQGVGAVTEATVNGGDEVALTGWAPLPNVPAPIVVTVAA